MASRVRRQLRTAAGIVLAVAALMLVPLASSTALAAPAPNPGGYRVPHHHGNPWIGHGNNRWIGHGNN
jgi:hypothetical protein